MHPRGGPCSESGAARDSTEAHSAPADPAALAAGGLQDRHCGLASAPPCAQRGRPAQRPRHGSTATFSPLDLRSGPPSASPRFVLRRAAGQHLLADELLDESPPFTKAGMRAWVYWRDLPRRSRFLACSKFLRLTGYFPPFPFAGSRTVPRLAFSDAPEFDTSHAFLAVLVPVYVIRVIGQPRASICVAIHSKDDYSGLEATGVNLADLGVTQEEWGTLHSRLGDVPTVLHALRAFGITGARQLELFEFHTLAYPLGVPLVFPATSFDDDAAWRVTHELLPWEFAAGLAGAGMIHAWLHDSEKQKFSKTFGTGLQPWFRDFVRAFTGQEQGAASGIAELRTALRNDYAAALGLCPGPSRAAPSRSWPASLRPLDPPDCEIPWDQLVEPWGLAETHFHHGAIEEAWNSPGRKGRSLYARPARGSSRLRKPAVDVIDVDAGADTPAPADPDAPAPGSAPDASNSSAPPPATAKRSLLPTGRKRIPPPPTATDAATGGEETAPPPAGKQKTKKAPAQPRRLAPSKSAPVGPRPGYCAKSSEEPAPRPAQPEKRKRRQAAPEDDFSDDDWGPPQRRRAASPPPPASGDEGEESDDDSDPDPEPEAVVAAPKRRSATKEIVRLPPPLTGRRRREAARGGRPPSAGHPPSPSATPAAQPAPHYAPLAAAQPAQAPPQPPAGPPFVPPADPWAATRAALLAGNGPPDLVWLAQHAAAAAAPAAGAWAPQAGFQLAAPTPAITAGTAPAQTGPPAGAATAGDAQNQREHRESRCDRAKDRTADKDRRKSSPATKSAGSKRTRSASPPPSRKSAAPSDPSDPDDSSSASSDAGSPESDSDSSSEASAAPSRKEAKRAKPSAAKPAGRLPSDLVRPANLLGLQLPAAETGLHTAATELAERLRQIEQGFTNYLMPGGNNIAGSAAGAVDPQVAPMIANFGLFCIRETIEFCWGLVTQGLAQANVQNAIGLVARIGEIRARMPGGACGRSGELIREWDALTRPLYHRLREAVRALSVLRAYMRPSADLTRSLNQAGQAVAAWPDSAKLLRSSSGRGTSSFLQNPPLGPHELRKFDKQTTATLAVGTPEAMTAAFLAAGGAERRARRERGGRKHNRGGKAPRAPAAGDDDPDDRDDGRKKGRKKKPSKGDRD
eukprot:tig00000042_g15593.t1